MRKILFTGLIAGLAWFWIIAFVTDLSRAHKNLAPVFAIQVDSGDNDLTEIYIGMFYTVYRMKSLTTSCPIAPEVGEVCSPSCGEIDNSHTELVPWFYVQLDA